MFTRSPNPKSFLSKDSSHVLLVEKDLITWPVTFVSHCSRVLGVNAINAALRNGPSMC